jgi:hypothetical protein
MTSLNSTAIASEQAGTKKTLTRPSSSLKPKSKRILTLQEQVSDLKKALRFDKNQYLSPSNDMSQHKQLYSVRMYYSNSMESLDVPIIVHPRPNYCTLGAPALLIQDQAENCCKSDKLDDLKNQKLHFERKIVNLKQYQNLNKEDLVLSLNQIEQSIGIIFLSTAPYINNLENQT